MFRWIFVIGLLASAAFAEERRPSHCIAMASAPGMQYLHKASFRDTLEKNHVRISYIAHSSFLIQAEDGVSAVTDYTGFVGVVDFQPTAVTMNHAHDTHYTDNPDPSIAHVLKGWGSGEDSAVHHLDLGSMLIRNVPTDIRRFESVEIGGNSIFVFEVAGLCIAHLGHLHHEPTAAQYAALGRMDVVMAAVDGGMSLDTATMMKILRHVKARVVIPMHWFESWTLEAFLTGMSDEYEIEIDGASEMVLSLRDLPRRPTIRVLAPRYLQEP